MNLITDEGKYYLYRHIRLDKNEVFYVGIGTKNKSNSTLLIYRRAYTHYNRNIYWQRIVNKTEYRVEIICETDEWEFIKEKEKEFIALYGRANLNLGTLCNLTDGGEGSIGRIPTEKFKQAMAKRRGIPLSEGHKQKIINARIENPRIISKETRLKISQNNSGRIVKEETKETLSLKAIQRHQQGIYKGTAAKGSNASNARLTEEQVLEIKELLLNHVPLRTIAKEFGIKINTVVNIYKGNSWSHLTGFNREIAVDRRRGFNERSKLTPDDVREIKKLLKEGNILQKDIAAKFGVARNHISNINTGTSWSNIT